MHVRSLWCVYESCVCCIEWRWATLGIPMGPIPWEWEWIICLLNSGNGNHVWEWKEWECQCSQEIALSQSTSSGSLNSLLFLHNNLRRLKLLDTHSNLFNDLENKFVHYQWSVYTVHVISVLSAWSPAIGIMFWRFSSNWDERELLWEWE